MLVSRAETSTGRGSGRQGRGRGRQGSGSGRRIGTQSHEGGAPDRPWGLSPRTTPGAKSEGWMISAAGYQDWYIGLGLSFFVIVVVVVIVATVLTLAARIADQAGQA